MTSGLSGSPAETVWRTLREVEGGEVELHERAEERRRRAERGHARALEHAQAELGIELAALIPQEDRRAHAPLTEELAPGRLGPARVGERPVQVGGRQVLPEARRDLVAGAHRGVRVQHHLGRRHRARGEVEEQRIVGARLPPGRLRVAGARDQLVVAHASRLDRRRRRRSRGAATGTGRGPWPAWRRPRRPRPRAWPARARCAARCRARCRASSPASARRRSGTCRAAARTTPGCAGASRRPAPRP